MKALVAGAEWNPREGYSPTKKEAQEKRVSSGSQVWQNPVVRVMDVGDPNPEPDELVLKVDYCGICGSDTHVYESDEEGYIIFSGPAKLPCVLGHEYSGEVVETGKDVEDFKKGDIVTSESVLWCGKCPPCRQGMLNQCDNVELMGLTSYGAFSEYIAVKAKYCWNLGGIEERFSREDTLKVGTLIEPMGCAYNGIFISGVGFCPGAYAIVYGAGPIGLGAVILLKAAGAGMIISIDVMDERLDIAKKMGADFVFNAKKTDSIVEAVEDLTGAWGADLQIEAAGAAKETLPIIEKLYSKRSKVIYLGRADSYGTLDLNTIVSGAHSLIGSRGHSGYGIFPNIIRLIQGGRLEGIQEMVTSVFPFNGILEAFEASTKRTDGKILVRIN
jgi:threonine dehydrogenase-like Zn-dependent dehydrogenase